MKLFQDDEEEVGEVFQDETNMAALLFYKQGGSDEYRMVRHHELNAKIDNLSLLSMFPPYQVQNLPNPPQYMLHAVT